MMNPDASSRVRIVNVLRHDTDPMGQSATTSGGWARATCPGPARPSAATAATTAATPAAATATATLFATLRPCEGVFL